MWSRQVARNSVKAATSTGKYNSFQNNLTPSRWGKISFSRNLYLSWQPILSWTHPIFETTKETHNTTTFPKENGSHLPRWNKLHFLRILFLWMGSLASIRKGFGLLEVMNLWPFSDQNQGLKEATEDIKPPPLKCVAEQTSKKKE